MIDGWGRRKLEPLLMAIGARLANEGISANAVTIASLLVGLCAGAAVVVGWFWLAIALILLSRLGDGLDGAVAHLKGRTDLGGYLDIVLDFVFYGAIPLAFVIHDPAANAVSGAVLLFSFYVNGASFLAYATIAEKRRLMTLIRGEKSFFFTVGLAEAGETLIFFLLVCLLPAWFPILAYLFAALTLYTAVARIVLAARAFR
ncbi:CDP-alcohol phosphatidyltransferase family protein [Chelativorans sp. AA-79]|uniref:CDP-alcohol phosphatidyltransferase family protein n=1 Tax=Chelativorans sp. AA-79 TaxID=3028735 RepID=UPI0023F96F4F|nr:CDP-alcohol phosphatidyltransferase family protein [Chelativorans sp. AA-79]WEX12014.1 CDP-alcohol phosphatidyltransferase family protein [Chelativorans sp. AA-79]